MKIIKVLHISPTMKSGGGIEENLMRYFRRVDTQKIHFDFIQNSYEEAEFEGEIINRGSILLKTAPYRKNLIINAFDKLKAIKGGQYDAIHIHTVGAAMLIDGMIARVCGVKKIIYHVHTMYPKKKVLHRICTPLFKLIGTDYWACSAEAGKYFYGDKIVKNNRYKVVHNALELECFKIDKQYSDQIKEGFEIKDQFIVGFVGRLSAEKKVDFVIEIFRELLNDYSNSLLLIVGDGEDKARLEKKVCEMKLGKSVIFTGNRKDIHRVMQVMDVILMPSLYEGLGIVAIEAQALGKKIIVSENVPKEVKITNNLYRMGLDKSSRVWAKKVIDMMKIEYDEEFIDKIVKGGYDISKEVEKLESYYSIGMESKE